MSSDSEKKGSSEHFPSAPQFPSGVYPYMQPGNMQFQPVYFQPVPYDVATSVNGEDQQPFIQAEGEKKCFFQRLCKRWRGRKCARKCRAVVDDGRALGNLNNFIAGLLFGTFSPFFSLLCVFGFETKKLTRTGALFGNANFFLLLAFSLIALRTNSYVQENHFRHGAHGLHPFMPFDNTTASNSTELPHNVTDVVVPANPQRPQGEPNQVHQDEDNSSESHDSHDKTHAEEWKEKHHRHKNKHWKNKHNQMEGADKEHGHGQRGKGCKMFKYAVGASVIAGLVFLITALKSFKRFMSIYRTRENKPESDTVKVVSEAGNCRGFFFGLLASLIWPMVGTALVLIVRRKNLTSRYGALHGLGVFFVLVGILGAFHGVPPFAVLKGLLLCQITSAHFKRAIASANALEAKTANC